MINFPNKTGEKMFKLGDHLVTSRIAYTHHGIYIGNNQVIHYSGLADDQSSGEICQVSLEKFCNGNKVRVKQHPSRKYSPIETVERASSRILEDWYNVLLNNCEHFANWCIEGKHESEQVNDLIKNVAACVVYRELYQAYKKSKQPMTPLIVDQLYQSTLSKLSQTELKDMASSSITQLAPELLGTTIANTTISSLTSSAATTTSSTASGIASAAAGSTAGVVAGSTIGTTAAGIVAGVAGTTAAPLVATVAVSAAVGYGVKKIWDWLSD